MAKLQLKGQRMSLSSGRWMAMVVAGSGLLGAMAGSANAAPITWSTGTFSDVSILPNAADVIYAIDTGGYTTDTTVGGITFLYRNQYDHPHTNAYVDISREHDSTNLLYGRSSGDLNFDAVLNTAMYNSASTNAAITLEGLTSGTTYQVLLLDAYGVDVDNHPTPYGLTLTMQGSDGVNISAAEQYSYASGPLGGYVLGTFTADATTQSLSLNTPNWGSYQINALVVSEVVPEPASLGVLALGVVGLIARRRR